MAARRAQLLLALLIAAMSVVAVVRAPSTTSVGTASPRATDPLRPKVWDFPGHNKW